MRIVKIVALVLFIPILLIPISVADITPDPIWPPSDLLHRDAAHNLTTWFATSLNVHIDTNQTGEWFLFNQPYVPEGLRAEDCYSLPVLNGSVNAYYLANGMLSGIHLDGEIPYVAESDDEDGWREVTYQIASDLGLDYSRAEFLYGIVIFLPELPEGTYVQMVELREPSPLGDPYNFNSLTIGILTPDLKVRSVGATVWFRSTGDPGIEPTEAVLLSGDNAVLEHDAREPSGWSESVAVWNGTSYVYLIHTSWDVSFDSSYSLDEWVDVNTGEVLGQEGPELVVLDPGFPGGWLWIILAIMGISLVVGLAVFYRINSERALDHFTRGRIFGYLQANPGANYTMIRESLRLSNGTAAYHLWVLERLGFVRSVSKGRMKQFYPQGVSLSKGSLILTRLQYSILDLLEAEGPLSQSEIAKSMEMSRQRSHYNVKVLRSLELIQRTENGKEELTFKGEEMISEGENGLFISPSSKEEGSKGPT